LAIPVGTYVEGVIDRVTKGGRSGPSLQMHFTRLLYANGYSVAIDGANTQAKALSPNSSSPKLTTFAGEKGSYSSLAAEPSAQQSAVQSPSTHNTGVFAGLAIGSAAAAIAIVVLWHYHRGSSGVLFDTGWQFEMVLQSPLTVDAGSVAAAAPGAQKP
jgi:hypothetical protein